MHNSIPGKHYHEAGTYAVRGEVDKTGDEMAARLFIAARFLAIILFILSVALIVARWRYPQHQQRSEGMLEFWKQNLRQWRLSRARAKEQAKDMRALRGKKVLLANSDERSARVLAWRLQSLHCKVTTSRNGTQGLSESASSSYDAAIVEALLPDVSAVDFYNSLPTPKPVVVFVGSIKSQRRELAALGTGVDWLDQSFDPDEAIAAAGRLLRTRTISTHI